MAKGLDAINKTVAQADGGERELSKRTYLKKGQSVIVRIPENIVENLHVFQTVSVFGSILTSLSYHGEGRTERDLYHEAHQMMVADHNKRKAAGDPTALEKGAWTKANQLAPKPLFLFGVILLQDFTQGKKNNLYEAGTPILLETNLGKDRANIDALTSFLTNPVNARKFGKKPFQITCTAANKYTFTPLDEEDLLAMEGGEDMLKVFNKTAGQTVEEEAFDNAIFESTTERQIEDLQKIGFDVSRLQGVEQAPQQGQPLPDIGEEDIPF